MSRVRLAREEYNKLVQTVFERDNWQCRVCRYRSMLAAHHVIFRSHGGGDLLENLITLCAYCHEAVHRSFIKIEYSSEFDTFQITSKPGWTPKMKVK